jgi:hypothetical protein
MIETATDAMRVILDRPESAEAQSAVQHLLKLVVERHDQVAFHYLGTLLRQSMYPVLTAYIRPFFIQAVERVEKHARALESAVNSHSQIVYQAEKDVQHFQALERLQTMRQNNPHSGDESQQTAASLHQSLMLLSEQLKAHLHKIEADYPDVFTEQVE